MCVAIGVLHVCICSSFLTRFPALGKDPSQEATMVEKILNLEESSSSVKET